MVRIPLGAKRIGQTSLRVQWDWSGYPCEWVGPVRVAPRSDRDRSEFFQGINKNKFYSCTYLYFQVPVNKNCKSTLNASKYGKIRTAHSNHDYHQAGPASVVPNIRILQYITSNFNHQAPGGDVGLENHKQKGVILLDNRF